MIRSLLQSKFFLFALLFLAGLFPDTTTAATLQINPSTGVYSVANTFSVRVVVNTVGAPINAAEGTLQFNARELSVVNIDRTGSIFNLWVTEPTFSNTAGTISFSGGVPSGYTGVGTVFTVTFRSLTASDSRVSFTNGAVLANDGRGTNALTGMSGGTYTISAAAAQPQPERIIEYVPPANTPAAPVITSTTHPDQTAWYPVRTATLGWNLPPGITQVRTLLDSSPTTIPTRVYETPIKSIELPDLPEGVSYFHLQFRNAEGWGRVSHLPLRVDTERPTITSIELLSDPDSARAIIKVNTTDTTSPVERFKVKIDGQPPLDFTDVEAGVIELPVLRPGYYILTVEALDAAGNAVIDTFSLTIAAFASPTLAAIPAELSDDVVPVFRGLTRPAATVVAEFTPLGAGALRLEVMADAEGNFALIPATAFVRGVYDLSVYAIDQNGAESQASAPVRFVVQPPGFVLLGNRLISLLSVVVPLVALAGLLFLSLWLSWFYFRRLRRRVVKESSEAVAIVESEFSALLNTIKREGEEIAAANRTKKLTAAEGKSLERLATELKQAKTRILKEAIDVKLVVSSKTDK